MFLHIHQQLTSKMVDDLSCQHQQNNEAIQYENKALQGEIRAKEQRDSCFAKAIRRLSC